MKRVVIVSLLFTLIALLGIFPASIVACSCLPQTFEEKYDDAQIVDTVYVFGEVRMHRGRFLGWVSEFYHNPIHDHSFNEDRYYMAYQWKSHKGCRGRRGQYIFYRTAGSSAACGAYLSPGWYVLGSYTDSESKSTLKSINLCGLIQPWKELTYDEYSYVNANTETSCDAPAYSIGGGAFHD